MEYILILAALGYLVYRVEKLEKKVENCKDVETAMANQYRSLEDDIWDLQDKLEEKENRHRGSKEIK
jgi:hypothetical protein